MTVTNDQSLDEIFLHHDKEVARTQQREDELIQAKEKLFRAWSAFRSGFLKNQLALFYQHVGSRRGIAVPVADSLNSYGVELQALSGTSLEGGARLVFKLNPQPGTFSAETIVRGKQLRHEAVDPSDATPEWINRWFAHLLADFRSHSD